MEKETKQQNIPSAQMSSDTVVEPVDYSKKENQIGCGYCAKEKDCKIRDPKTNKAKQGCKEWLHWQDSNGW